MTLEVLIEMLQKAGSSPKEANKALAHFDQCLNAVRIEKS